ALFWIWPSKVEAEVEPTEAVQQFFTLVKELEVVTNVRQLVSPMPHIVRSIGHLVGIEAVGESDQTLPFVKARDQIGLRALERRPVGGGVEPFEVQSRALLVRVVSSERGENLEIGIGSAPPAIRVRDLPRPPFHG